jgi:hypothetical protein
LGKPKINSSGKSLPPLRGGTSSGNAELSSNDLSLKNKLRPKISDELSPIPSPKKRVSINTDKNVFQVSEKDFSDKNSDAKQKGLQLRLSGDHLT